MPKKRTPPPLPADLPPMPEDAMTNDAALDAWIDAYSKRLDDAGIDGEVAQDLMPDPEREDGR